VGERSEGDKNVKGITERKEEIIFPIIDTSYILYNNVHGKVTKCLLRRGRMYIGYLDMPVICEVYNGSVFILYVRGNHSSTICCI
jgi:hypothetical protein